MPFVDALAHGLLDDPRTRADPLALTRATILLPTRRACRALSDAFLRAADGTALLLPRLVPLGDVDVDEIELRGDEPADPTLSDEAAGVDLPEALPGLRRQLLLTRLILSDPLIEPGQAAQLARELARLLDQIATERLDLAGLRGLVPDAYAAHWQKVLDFLAILTDRWPALLRQEGAVDGATRRDAVLGAQAALWGATPPREPVIAAGSTGSIATLSQRARVGSAPAAPAGQSSTVSRGRCRRSSRAFRPNCG